MEKQNFSQGTDVRGDYALFIENNEFKSGWELEPSAIKKLQDMNLGTDAIFFRIIFQGVQSASHGWINPITGNVEQWG